MSPDRDFWLVAGTKPWHRRVFDEVLSAYLGEWALVSTRAELEAAVAARRPRRIFFLHWSWLVPDEIVESFDCVCFHMTDVPFGRGGSPLQNLIVRGITQTRLTALRMTSEVDAGPVYDKRDLDLHGTAEEIYVRSTHLAADMIRTMIETDPLAEMQSGEAVPFTRRTPAESELPELSSLAAVHDFVRMLDAEGYPRAFLRWKGYRYEFRRAALYDGRIEADVVITREDGP